MGLRPETRIAHGAPAESDSERIARLEQEVAEQRRLLADLIEPGLSADEWTDRWLAARQHLRGVDARNPT